MFDREDYKVQTRRGSALRSDPRTGYDPSRDPFVVGMRSLQGQIGNRAVTQLVARSMVVQRAPIKTVSSIARARLALAASAIAYTRGIFPSGPGNQISALKSSKLNSRIRLLIARTDRLWTMTPAADKLASANPIEATAAKAFIAGGGNCGEHAAVAYSYLRANAAGTPINYVVHSMDHAFVIIGKLATDSDDKMVVADPWPTKATAVLWTDHFGYVARPSRAAKLTISKSVVADGKGIAKAIAAGLTLDPSAVAMLAKHENDPARIRQFLGATGGLWSHEHTAAPGRRYRYR